MSGVEALARVLVASADGQKYAAFGGPAMAEDILADPGPLLAALAEAGVLRDQPRRRRNLTRDESFPGNYRTEMVDEHRYVTEWSPDAHP